MITQMPSATIYRLSGLALLIAFALQLLGFALHPPGLESLAIFVLPQYGPAHLVLAVSWTFALLGLPGLYLAQAARAGRIGLVGVVASALMALLSFELVMFEAVAAPTLASDPAASHLVGPDGALVNGELGMIGRAVILGIVTLAGPVLLGVASLRAGVLPRASALLQIASVVGLPPLHWRRCADQRAWHPRRSIGVPGPRVRSALPRVRRGRMGPVARPGERHVPVVDESGARCWKLIAKGPTSRAIERRTRDVVVQQPVQRCWRNAAVGCGTGKAYSCGPERESNPTVRDG